MPFGLSMPLGRPVPVGLRSVGLSPPQAGKGMSEVARMLIGEPSIADPGVDMGIDELTVEGLLFLAVSTALFVTAPHLSMQYVDGHAGVFLAALATGFLCLSALAPFLPRWGVAIAFPWILHALWVLDYFDLVSGWITTMTQWADPGSGLDGFLGAVLLLIPVILACLLFLVAIPGALAVAGGFAVNAPALWAESGRCDGPFRPWSIRRQLLADHDSASPPDAEPDAEPPTFAVPRWRPPHDRTGDRSLRRRQLTGVLLAWSFAALAGASVAVAFSQRESAAIPVALVVIVAAAAVVSLLHRWVTATVRRDVSAWALPHDEHWDTHIRSVHLANQWAADVDPADRRDGRALVANLLAQSEAHLYAAQQLSAAAERDVAAVGPGWTPPTATDLAEARAGLQRVQQGLAQLATSAQHYRQSHHRDHRRGIRDQRSAAVAEDAVVLREATVVYLRNYRDVWDQLQARSAGAGLPDLRTDHWPASWPDIPLATLPSQLATIVARVADTPAAGDAWRLLLVASLTQAATARLVLLDSHSSPQPQLDARIVTELLDQIATRAAAEREVRESGRSRASARP